MNENFGNFVKLHKLRTSSNILSLLTVAHPSFNTKCSVNFELPENLKMLSKFIDHYKEKRTSDELSLNRPSFVRTTRITTIYRTSIYEPPPPRCSCKNVIYFLIIVLGAGLVVFGLVYLTLQRDKYVEKHK